MKAFLTTTALAAAVAVGSFAGTAVRAQDNQPCVGEQCPGGKGGPSPGQMMPKKRMNVPEQNNQNNEMQGGQKMPQGSQTGDQTNDQVMPRKKRVQNAQPNDNNNMNANGRRVGENRKWRFDPNRERRRNHKDSTFRFYFGGFWYPEPYWTYYGSDYGPGPRYRISCGEGRSIVAERYNRVRVLECNGGTYTYVGRRAGDDYRILLNARTGRIVGRALI